MAGCAENLLGQKFSRLTVVQRAENIKGKYAAWFCVCDCGGSKIVRAADLKRRKTQSCGCLHKVCNSEKVAANIAKRTKPHGVAAFNSLYFDYQYSAKIRGFTFALTKYGFKKLVEQNCAYCGTEPNTQYKKRNVNGTYIYNGIDRVDNVKGYVPGNCVPCCKFCNYAKSRGTKEEFLVWIKRLQTLGR